MEKKDLGNLTEKQHKMLEFWCNKGYNIIPGDLIIEQFYNLAQEDLRKEKNNDSPTLSKEQKETIERYIPEAKYGLNLHRLTDFYLTAQSDVIKMFDRIEKEDALRHGGTNAETCWKLLKEEIKKEVIKLD